MDYKEYNTEYQKVILKQQLMREISIKKALIETIRNTDKKDVLEMLIMTNDFDGQIAYNDEMLAQLGDDPEIQELFDNNSNAIAELKKTAEDRLKTLQEQEQDKDKDKEKDKEQEDKTTQNEENEHDERKGRSHNEQQDSSKIASEQDIQYRIPYPISFARNQMPRYGSQEFYVQNIKYNVRSCINSLYSIKANVDLCPSPMILSYLSSCRDVFDSNIKLGVVIQQMPGCDAELMVLSDELIRQSQLVIDTVNKYIEQYRQRFEENARNKQDEEQSLEDIEEQLQQGDEEKPDDKQQEETLDEEFETNDRELDNSSEEELEEDERSEETPDELEEDDTSRKSWELSPQEKAEIQISNQQITQEYNERQANPQPEIPQPSKEGTEMEM